MIESFAQLEEIAANRDLAEVFLESDEQEHAIPAERCARFVEGPLEVGPGAGLGPPRIDARHREGDVKQAGKET